MAALFVKDLHPEVSEVILSNRFRPAGHVQSVHICRDRKTGSPLGYAYVNFRYRDDAERAIDMFNFELLLGRPMRVMWSNWEPTAKPIKGGNIFIRNLDWSIDCTSLFDTFSVFGRIVSCKVVESKGYGYVQYESAEAAERLNGKLLNDRQSWERFVQNERHIASLKQVRRWAIPHSYILETNKKAVGASSGQKTVHNPDRKPASASEDISQIVYTAASQMVQAAGSPAPVNNVEAVETAGPENSEESVETAASEGSVEAVKTVASDDRVEAVEATAPVEATETAAPEETLEAVSEIRVPAPLQDVPKFPPPQKRLTIYMLESADLDDQITMAYDYLLPLVAEIHPADAKQITLMLVQGENNFKIMNMISDPEHLQAKVDKMDTLLRARETGVKL
ncbi:hypothetical protein KOW79_000029, partial [Hemibagrus wyckioides]